MEYGLPLTRSVLSGTDRVVFKGRCIIVGARLAAVSADSSAVFYDGTSADGEKKFTLTALAKCSDEFDPVGGIIFEQGCYVDLTGSGAEVVIQALPSNSSGAATA